MLITVTVASILAIATLVWLFNRVLPFTVCPVCAGVFLTWAWLVGAHLGGYQIDLTVPAFLMGGSVVGSMYQLERKSRNASAGARVLWKVLFVSGGFIAAYALLEQLWAVLLVAAVFLFSISFAFLSLGRASDTREETAKDIEGKMKECC